MEFCAMDLILQYEPGVYLPYSSEIYVATGIYKGNKFQSIEKALNIYV